MIKQVLHTGVTVDDLAASVALYQKLGYKTIYQLEKPDFHARLVAMQSGDNVIELWRFDNTSHPNYQFIRNHIGLLSDNLDEDVQAFLESGFKIVIPKTDGALLRYVFVQDPAGLCYEVAVEREKK